jgi:trimethylamine:corrinoid methyltransferase-like protein
MGSIDNSGTVALEQLIVDHDIALQCKRIRDGVTVTEEKNHFADILEQGPGGSFLGTEATVAACRSGDYYESTLVDRLNYNNWDEKGRPGIYTKAKEKVEEILASPQKNPLSDNELGKLNDVIRKIEESGSDKK